MDNPVSNNNDRRADDVDCPAEGSSPKPVNTIARRRLLKGAMAAAPAVFTLQSGAARAATSNLRCLTNRPDFSPEKDHVHVGYNKDQSETPNWQRSRVSGLKVTNPNGKNAKLVEISQNYAIDKQYRDKYGRTWVSFTLNDGTTSGYVLDGQQNDIRIHDIYNSYHRDYFFTLNKNVDRYQVFAVDQNGDYIGGLDKGNPVTVSCWTSFATADSGNSGGSWLNYWW